MIYFFSNQNYIDDFRLYWYLDSIVFATYDILIWLT